MVHNPDTGGCILSRRPDDDPNIYDTASASWNTYNTVCPKDKGYVQYDSHQPPLCLRYLGEILEQLDAVSRCEEDGAKLVRVKTTEVYSIVQQIVNVINTEHDKKQETVSA
nr:hypothetical protein BaRGS_026154 [Batillaria attramentaria]